MIPVRFILAALSLSLAMLVSSCSMFGSSSPRPQSAGQQEYDPMTNSWTRSSRVVVPPPAQPAAPMATTAAPEPEKKSLAKKTLGWLPFVD